MNRPVRAAVTISRMSGSGGRSTAICLARYLDQRAPGPCPWTVFDRNLISRVLEDHHLNQRLAQFLPEDHRSWVSDVIEELLGLHPPSWTLVRQTSETVLNLLKLGQTIVLGRGGNIVARDLKTVLHVRLVGTPEKRRERIQEELKLNASVAERLMKREDRGRARYYKDHFQERIDDPLKYHLVIQTDDCSPEEIATLIGNTVIRRFGLGSTGTALAA